jgi:hypothetical protein
LVADPRFDLQGLGAAFFNLLFNPTSSAGSVLDVGYPCALGTGRGIFGACLPGDGAIVAFIDCTSPSSSSTLMVSTSELILVVSADTADLVRFPLLFFASATWAVAWEAGIFPVVCRVRHGAATLDGPLRDATGTSLTRGGGAAPCPPRCGPCSCSSPRHAAVSGTSRFLRGATKQDVNIPSEPRYVLKEL